MRSKQQTPESRRDERRRCELSWAASAVLGDGGSDQGFGVLLDVSRSGLRLRTPTPPPWGAQVQVRANAGEEIVATMVVVRWIQEVEPTVFEFGAEIADDDPEGEAFVEALMRANGSDE